MSRDFKKIRAWLHWKKLQIKRKELSEDDILFVRDIERLLKTLGKLRRGL